MRNREDPIAITTNNLAGDSTVSNNITTHSKTQRTKRKPQHIIHTSNINSQEVTTSAVAKTIQTYIQTALEFTPHNDNENKQQQDITIKNKQTDNMTQNYKDNNECGDTIRTKNKNTTRIYFQNIRGCKKNN